MKKLFTLLVLAITLITSAQAPQGFNYQATVRNSSGALITNQSVSFKFSILQNSDTGTVVYSENQTITTDDLGHASLVVGRGTLVTGTFSNVNWANGTYYLGIELNTGAGYVAMGTTQLLSVPYALYANTAGSTTGSAGGFTHYVGELFAGGIVISVYKDTTGTEHGLIASLVDIGTSAWSNIDNILIGNLAQSKTDGQENTTAIISQAGHTASAAKLCNDYSAGGFNDWYLPAIWELNKFYAAAYEVNRVLGDNNGIDFGFYWSSTENANNIAWSFDSSQGVTTNYYYSGCSSCEGGKNHINKVRAVRKF